MNVIELITELAKLPPGLDVMIPDSTGNADYVFLNSVEQSKVEIDDDDIPEDFEAILLIPI